MRPLHSLSAAVLLGLSALSAAVVYAAEPTCSRHGTQIDFVDSPKEAAALAKKQEKLVLVLHISGHFEDPGLT